MKATGKQRKSKGKIKGKVELRVWPEHGTFGVGVDETTGIWRICLQGKPKKEKQKNNVSQTHNNNNVTATTPTTPLGLA